MNKKEFEQYISEIENVYGKTLNNEQMNIWYENLKFMTIERFNYILSEIYKSNKFMPTLADILQVHKQIPYTVGQVEEKVTGHCSKCGDTGYVIYTEIINGMPYKKASVCSCKRQVRYDGRQCTEPKNKSDYYIPSVDELGLEVKENKPSQKEIVKSMNILNNSSFLSEDVKNIIRKKYREYAK